jgi:hypothetical protein
MCLDRPIWGTVHLHEWVEGEDLYAIGVFFASQGWPRSLRICGRTNGYAASRCLCLQSVEMRRDLTMESDPVWVRYALVHSSKHDRNVKGGSAAGSRV